MCSKQPPPPSPPPCASRGSRVGHSSHFLDNSHNAVGGYSNKGGTAPRVQNAESDGRPNDSSGCVAIHAVSRGSRIVINKSIGGEGGREPTGLLYTYSLRFVTWHAGMRDNYSKMRACAATPRRPPRWMRFLQLVPRVAVDY